jgi:putative SOS response-associated peptidase YedK
VLAAHDLGFLANPGPLCVTGAIRSQLAGNPIINRMPVILRPEDEESWLDPDTDEDRLLQLLIPYPDADMKRWAVSSLVNKVTNNIPEVLKPVVES